jgi:hypothetical protein
VIKIKGFQLFKETALKLLVFSVGFTLLYLAGIFAIVFTIVGLVSLF